jgi:hypothetical protein
MSRTLIALLLFASVAIPNQASAGSSRVLKVLPQYLDVYGRTSISPSLYDRDAYQHILSQNPERRYGLRFAVQWKTRGVVWGDLKLRIECRGVTRGDLPSQLVIERTVQPDRWFTTWTQFDVTGEGYGRLGEITAWRVTLFEGTTLISEQKSFLW